MRHFAKLGELKHLAPTSLEAQAAIRDLQQFITDHFTLARRRFWQA